MEHSPTNIASEQYTVAQLATLGWLAVGDGYRAKNSELGTDGLPFARAGNIDGGFHFDDADRFPITDLHKVGQKVSRFGDVVFTSKGTVGRFGYVQVDTPQFVYAPQLCYWRSLNSSNIDSRWLYYWMNSDSFGSQAAGVKGQTDMAEYVSLGDQRRMILTIPPITEQRAIAGVLGALDDKIEQNRRTSAALEALARAVFRAWFVDFEPVNAKAAGATAFPGMPQPAFDALPGTFADSPLGPIPRGWAAMPLGEFVTLNPPRRLPKDTPAPYLDMAAMPTEGHAPEAWVMRNAGSGARFVNGDTLVARITPCLENGKTAYVDFLDEAQVAWGSTEYVVLRPKPPTPNLYAYLLARTDEFRVFAIQNMTGTSGRQRVPAESMGRFPVVTPPEAVLRAFGTVVEPLFEMSSAGVRESRKLSEVRDYLLPKLLSGAVRVGDAASSLVSLDGAACPPSPKPPSKTPPAATSPLRGTPSAQGRSSRAKSPSRTGSSPPSAS